MRRGLVERNNFTVKKLSPDEWEKMGKYAHLVGFHENREASMNRIDYALIATDEKDEIFGWLTARELDAESVYWQFGAALPNAQSSAKAVECYSEFLKWTFDKYKRITTLVENENVRYLKLAMHYGFRIIGCRIFDGVVYVELLNKGEIK
jgi:RimJ/RimL family protein N-acetyltransferase